MTRACFSLVNGKVTAALGEFDTKRCPKSRFEQSKIYYASKSEVEEALMLAWKAFFNSKYEPRIIVAAFYKIADLIEENKNDIKGAYLLETPFQESDFLTEVDRTINQLRYFAGRIKSGKNSQVISSETQQYTNIVKKMRPIGPVLVIPPINFPLAFGVVGNDFCDAIASGCPVVVKAHPEHPVTSEIVAKLIAQAFYEVGLDPGFFSMLHTTKQDTELIIRDSRIKAVAFTGSIETARILKRMADEAGKPFYGECGSTNSVFVLPNYFSGNYQDLATSFIGSLTTRWGQMCTAPKLLFVPESNVDFDSLVASRVNVASMHLLSQTTLQRYNKGIQRMNEDKLMSKITNHAARENEAAVRLYKLSAPYFIHKPTAYQEEIFGPCAVIVNYKTLDEMLACAMALQPSLVSSIFSLEDEEGLSKLIRIQSSKVGRIAFNSMPTGVVVCEAMHHGGPYPACTVDVSSVGGSQRFQRPVSYQNFPCNLWLSRNQDW